MPNIASIAVYFIDDFCIRKMRKINSNLQKYDAYYNYLNITESELDNIKTLGNYTLYLTSVTSNVFKDGVLLLLEVRRVKFGNKIGYMQRVTGIYGLNKTLTRHLYLNNEWTAWL